MIRRRSALPFSLRFEAAASERYRTCGNEVPRMRQRCTLAGIKYDGLPNSNAKLQILRVTEQGYFTLPDARRLIMHKSVRGWIDTPHSTKPMEYFQRKTTPASAVKH
jgi:hypothetical protein